MPSIAEDRPTVAFIRKLRTHVKNTKDGRDKWDEKVDDLYRNQHSVIPNPDAFTHKPHETHLTLADDIADRLLAMFRRKPRITVPRDFVGADEDESAGKVEVGLKVLHELAGEEAGGEVWDNFDQDVVRIGRGCILCFPHRERWASTLDDKPEGDGFPKRGQGEKDQAYDGRVLKWKRGARLPFSMQYIPARRVYFKKGRGGLEWVLIVEMRSNEDILNDPAFKATKLRALVGRDMKMLLEETEVTTFANRNWIAWSTKDEVLNAPMAHKLGMVPAVIAKGIVQSGEDPVTEDGIGVLHQLYDLLVEADLTTTKIASFVSTWAWHPGVFTEGEGTTDRKKDRDGQISLPDILPDQPVTLKKGETLDIQGLLPDDSGIAREHMGRVMGSIERKSGGALFGQVGTTESGFQFNSAVSAQARKWGQIGDHLAGARKDMSLLFLQHVKTLGESLALHWKRTEEDDQGTPEGWFELDRKDISGNERIEVFMPPRLPLDEAGRWDLVNRAVEIGAYSLPDALRRYLDEELPEVRVLRARIARWRNSQPIAAIELQQIVERLNARASEQNQIVTPEEAAGMPDALALALQASMQGGDEVVPASAAAASTPVEGRTSIAARGRPAGVGRRPGGPRRGLQTRT